jgi:hypothetical protein
MALSRLENFIKSVEGNILYVNPNDLDSTDDITNQGNSLTRPFKTIQRALLEAARFSYQVGLDNDKFDKTTIMIYPGEHIIDNRPGYSIDLSGTIRDVNDVTRSLTEFSGISDFDITSTDNELYKYNSVFGGVIIPRGTSLVGMDLRKTKIRPRFVPDPLDDSIQSSAIFRLTGGCYFWQFSIFDGQGSIYKNYQPATFAPDFSHHKLTAFEYADDVNVDPVRGFTDLQMYYHKLTRAYGVASNRPIPDYPGTRDFQTRRPESQIVGSLGDTVGITTIIAGDGITPSTTVTVTTEFDHGFDIDTPIRVNGVDSGTSPSGYDGLYFVAEIIDEKNFKYVSSIVPQPATVNPTAAAVNVEVDTVTGCSPYVFNCSVRSVYGMNGMHADGSKSSGFKSMVVAQYTGISLQKDDNAFVKYNKTTGLYDDQATIGSASILHLDSRAIYKPDWTNTHIKASNDAFIQCVSIFAIGYAEHFNVSSGGDMSITNSNSNFGAKSLVSKKFRVDAFNRDNKGFITNIIPPLSLSVDDEISINTLKLDINKIRSVGISSNLYLYGYDSFDNIPPSSFNNYKLGGKSNEHVSVLLATDQNETQYDLPVLMTAPVGVGETVHISSKEYLVQRNQFGVNVINTSTNTINLRENHDIQTGEKIRFLSENGSLPDGIKTGQLYYAIRVGTGATNQLRIASGLNEANADIPIDINNKGGTIRVISRVSDKISGEVGHPIQWDSNNQNWYLKTKSGNALANVINVLPAQVLPDVSGEMFITRGRDDRRTSDKIYKLRYVIPKEEVDARAPLEGYIIQESSTTNDFVLGDLSSVGRAKNNRYISSCKYDEIDQLAYITTEIPHNLEIGSKVKVRQVTSTNNTSGAENLGFNGLHSVVGISSDLTFSYSLSSNPGEFTNNLLVRNSELPFITIKEFKNIFSIYSTETLQEFIPAVQDGIYYFTVIDHSNKADVNYFNIDDLKFSQNVGDLIPREDRDNPIDDCEPAVSYVEPDIIGSVVTNDPQRSISRETINRFLVSTGSAKEVEDVKITDVVLPNGTVGSAVSITTKSGHGFGSIARCDILSNGSDYVPGTYYGVRLVGPSSTRDATATITVDSGGQVSLVNITNGGSGYKTEHICEIVDIPRVSFANTATVGNLTIHNNVGTSFEISGLRNTNVIGIATTAGNLNGIFAVDVIDSFNTFTYTVNPSVGSTTAEIYNSYVSATGQSIKIDSITYSSADGIVTVGCASTHGLSVGNKIKISELRSNNVFDSTSVTLRDEEFYNNYFTVFNVLPDGKTFTYKTAKNVEAINSFSVGVTTGVVMKSVYLTQEGIPILDDEKLSGRMSFFVTGDIKYSSVQIVKTNATISVDNTSGLNRGDYLQIEDEVVRITSQPSPTSNVLNVLRGQLGSDSADHDIGVLIRKIRPVPIELHRPSISRASGHTFEYLGFGPGNYSTGFPQRQDRVLTEREIILSQSFQVGAGVNVYTGTNDRGDFYIGNKRIISPTGKEIIVDTPFPSDLSDTTTSQTKIDADDAIISKRLKVEGGRDQTLISSFSGPVVFSNEVNSISQSGISAVNLNLIGDLKQSRNITVGISTPIVDGQPGDLVLNGNPIEGGFGGWIYTTDNAWKRFGLVSRNPNRTDIIVNSINVVGGAITATTGDYEFLTVSGIATINQINVTGGGTINVDFARIGNSIHTGLTTFASETGEAAEFRKGSVGFYTNVNFEQPVDVLSGNTQLLINGNSEMKSDYYGVPGRGTRIINYTTDVYVEPWLSDQVGVGSGAIKIDLSYGNNFVIQAQNPAGSIFADGIVGPTTFFNFTNVVEGQQGSIKVAVAAATTATVGWGSIFYFPGGNPPNLAAGTTSLLGYYVFESPSVGNPGRIMISPLEDLRNLG